MKKREQRVTTNLAPRLLDAGTLAAYLGLGVTNATIIAKQAGACRQFKSRTVYDRVALDEYLDTLPSAV